MKKIFAMVVITLVLGLLGLGLLSAGQTSNCGGNTAALHGTRRVAMEIQSHRLYNGLEHEPLLAEPLLSEEDSLIYFDFGWGVKTIWVKKEIAVEEAAPIAICGEEYSNVPQPSVSNFWKRTPGNAAAFADGRGRILTPEEFEAIDFSQYTRVTEDDERLWQNQVDATAL